ncbi:proliferation marker protein Ki-67 [Dryobates pubescens]|nr:proliferation marker protein Ki-67 [Dryobates pubescens]
MPLLGNIVVIKRNGTDGLSFPLTESSCLFGRRPECDIRIHLPQVSKEHCKIEVNENKEAILTNLSTANPTKLNGGCFQQPVPLKHGDVLTILDRSFRFEYPLQSTLRKRRSRSPKDETLQVLHLQQVAEVESCKQTPGSKNIHVSDNAECEEKNANENKQAREENISKTLPIKLSTPKSLYRPRQSVKQKGMSPFSKLYEKLKSEFIVQKPLQGANAPQQAAKEDAKNVLLEPSAPISSSSCVQDLGSLTKEKEKGRRENTEEYKITMKQDTNSSELNQISTGGSAAKKSFTRTPQTSASKQVLGSTGRRSHFRDRKELSTTGGSKDSELPVTPSKENDGNARFLLEQCSIECLDSAGKTKHRTSATHKPAQTSTANVYEADVLTTPTSRRKGPRSHFVSPTSEASGMNPVTADTPTSRCRLSLKRKSLSEALAETQQKNSASRNGDLSQQPLAEDKCLKQNSEQHTPGKPVKEVVKEVCDQADSVDSKDGYCDTPAPLPNIKSSRRSNRQSKELPDKNVYSETLASEKVISELDSPAGQKSGSGRKKGRPRSSGLLTEKALEASAVEEHHKETTGRKDSGTREELTTEECHQKQDMAGASDTRPRRLSSKRRSSGSAAVLKDSETVSEMNISGLLAGEESGKKKSISQKRKSGDTLLQPLGKRKRVSFGGHLSPELFDKSLPPNSPLKKGATPARLSLPFGNSPRAVLKKTQGLKHFAVQELQKEKMSPKTVSAQKSPAASAPISGKATLNFTSGSPAPYKKGRFSVSLITPPLPIAEEQDAIEEGVNTEEKGAAQATTPKSSRINQDDKTSLTPEQLIRNAQPALKATPMRRRSGAVATIKSKRRSGASNANLLVAKSWAEVVKLGVAKPQIKTVKKSVQKGRSLKKTTQSSKTPERKVKGHFSTGHAESPATIVVGRAYSTAVRTSGRVPKVVKNPLWKLNMNMDESFTGMTEMFQTPENRSAKALPLVAVQKTDVTPICPAEEISELHTPEETACMYDSEFLTV